MLTIKNEINMYVVVCIIVLFACFFETSLSNAAPPSIPKASIFTNEIDRNKYIINQQPNGARLFKWDFSNTNQYVYSNMKKSIIYDFTNISGIESGKDTEEIISNAKLVINSLGNQTADMVLKDIETVVRHWKDEEKDKPRKIKLPSVPSAVISSVDESLMKRAGLKNMDLFIELAFPLPIEPLKLREQTVMDRSVPIAINNKIFTITGELKITLTDYVNIDGRNCARFESIADVTNSSDLNGNNKCAIKANTVYYFDINDRCLIVGGSAALISIRYEDNDTKRKIINDNHILILIKLKEKGAR